MHANTDACYGIRDKTTNGHHGMMPPCRSETTKTAYLGEILCPLLGLGIVVGRFSECVGDSRGILERGG